MAGGYIKTRTIKALALAISVVFQVIGRDQICIFAYTSLELMYKYLAKGVLSCILLFLESFVCHFCAKLIF